MNEYHKLCRTPPLTETRTWCVYIFNTVLICGERKSPNGDLNGKQYQHEPPRGRHYAQMTTWLRFSIRTYYTDTVQDYSLS